MENIISKGIMAILPIYIKGQGNCTIFYTKEETVELQLTIRTVIRRLCEYYLLDLKSSNKKYGVLLSCKYHPPIPFNKDNIFIQLKTRTPIGRHDGAHGYFDLDSIKRLKPMGKNTMIQLIDGTEIEALVSYNISKKYFNNGEIVRELIKDKADKIPMGESSFYENQDTPATKADIALLYMKILEIKESL